MATHEDVHAFADGELPPEDAADFRAHLGGCARCQAELNDILQLQARSEPGAAVPEAPPARIIPLFGRRPMRVAVMAGGALAAALVVALALPGRSGPEWTRQGERALEARLAWDGAAGHLPYGATRGGAGREAVPLSALAALEARGDWQGLGAAALLAGDADRAREALARAPRSQGRDADLAAALLAKGDLDGALELLDAVLGASPRHPQALWNRALALQGLGLRSGAADAFSQVAALGEPGWSAEAAARARELQATEAAPRERLQEATDAAAALVLDGAPMPPRLARAAPMLARITFFLALWSRGSAAEVRALAPLAQELDALAGDGRLAGWIDRTARRDFARRAPLASDFRRLVRGYYEALQGTPMGPRLRAGSGPDPLPPPESAALVDRIARSGETDMLLGALALTGRAGTDADADAYEREARAGGDPFFLRAAALERARQARARSDAPAAEAHAASALAGCKGASADYRCLQLHLWIAQHYKEQHRLVEAQEHAQAALELARAQLQLGAVDECLLQLGDIARLRGEAARTRAFLEERIHRAPADADARSFLHESLAVLRIGAFDAAGARAQLREAARARPLSRVGAYTLADAARMAPEPGDREWLDAVLTALRAGALSGAERALMDHVEGRALIDADPAAGAALLRRAIAAAAALPQDGVAQKVRAFSYRELRLDAGRRGDHAEVFRLLHEEGAAPLSPECAVAVEAHDDRVEIAARGPGAGPGGAASGLYRKRPEVPDARTLLPAEVKAAVAGCQAVKVFASPPVHGQGGLFPDDVAWSYAGPSAAAPAPSGSAAGRGELVVSDVESPPGLKLPRLAAWEDAARPGVTALTGAQATPGRVLGELADASVGLVELHTHGLVDLGVSDASLLALAPDAGGRWALTAQDIRRQKLPGRPVVLLAACRAARVAPFFHMPWSLPRAFTDAGARAVIAAPVDLPDAEARLFFRGVVERLRRGSPAPLALRDERSRWLAEGRGDWVRQVLVFE